MDVTRKIVQIALTSSNELPVLYALCDDGTVWHRRYDKFGDEDDWGFQPPIPQGFDHDLLNPDEA